MIVVVLIISGNECGIKSGRIVFLLYLFFRRLLLNRKITMVIISGWPGVTYASECFLPGLPSLQRKSLWKRGNHQALFESYAPIINCLERKNYGATWCYDSFHSRSFWALRSGWSAIYAYSQPASLFWFFRLLADACKTPLSPD